METLKGSSCLHRNSQQGREKLQQARQVETKRSKPIGIVSQICHAENPNSERKQIETTKTNLEESRESIQKKILFL